MKKSPTNTTEQINSNPLLALLTAMGGIEAQEAQGQRELANSDTLPTRVLTTNGKAILESFGVKFIGPVEGDSLFQFCELPTGWSKRPTDHSMWSELVDEEGRVRAMIFYKAAFYDRDAFIRLCRRFNVKPDWENNRTMKRSVVFATDCDNTVFATDPIPYGDRQSYEVDDEQVKVAESWLTENYPEWNSAAAYWD